MICLICLELFFQFNCVSSTTTHKEVIRLTLLTHTICKEANITAWIDYGTLVGSLWRGRALPYYSHGDFGILDSDRSKLEAVKVFRLNWSLYG